MITNNRLDVEKKRRIQNKQIDTITRAFIALLPTETAMVNFCSAMESLDSEVQLLESRLKVAEGMAEALWLINKQCGEHKGNGFDVLNVFCISEQALTAWKKRKT